MLEGLRDSLLERSGDMPVRFELLRRGGFRARLLPPPALSIDPCPETREGLKRLIGRGWSEFEFDPVTLNGRQTNGTPPSADRTSTAGGTEVLKRSTSC